MVGNDVSPIYYVDSLLFLEKDKFDWLAAILEGNQDYQNRFITEKGMK